MQKSSFVREIGGKGLKKELSPGIKQWTKISEVISPPMEGLSAQVEINSVSDSGKECASLICGPVSTLGSKFSGRTIYLGPHNDSTES